MVVTIDGVHFEVLKKEDKENIKEMMVDMTRTLFLTPIPISTKERIKFEADRASSSPLDILDSTQVISLTSLNIILDEVL